jgi:hypothetical protein
MTTFGDGVFQYGGTPVGAALDMPWAKHWFVDAKRGSNSNSGKSPTKPLLTMEAAFNKIASGDVIHVRGKVREQLTTPTGVFDVTIYGGANLPRHADDHTESGRKRGSSAATWTAPASGSVAGALLNINQQGWRVEGVCFQISGSATRCIELIKTDDSGDDERDGGHFKLVGCKLQNDVATPLLIGLALRGGQGFVGLYNNLFMGFAEGVGVTGATGGQQGWHEYIGNRFDHCGEGVDVALYHSLVKGNTFHTNCTIGLELASGAANVITENVFMGDYDALVAGTGDFWFNNYALDTASGEVSDTTGQTTAVPAA